MKKKILIYDDDKEILILCKAILSKFSYQVETLSICENIISDIKMHNPDLILMDLWIPDIGGEKAITIAKSDDSIKVPILIFSANADIKRICEKVHADGYVEKPFSVNSFVAIINKYLG